MRTITDNYDEIRENKVVYRALAYRNRNDDVDYSTLTKDEKIHYFENKAINEYWVEQDLHYLANAVRELRKENKELNDLLVDKENKLRKANERTLSVLMQLHGIEVD